MTTPEENSFSEFMEIIKNFPKISMLAQLPPVTKAWYARAKNISHRTVNNRIKAKKIAVDKNNHIPFQELFR